MMPSTNTLRRAGKTGVYDEWMGFKDFDLRTSDQTAALTISSLMGDYRNTLSI